MNKDFRISVGDDPDHEDLTAEIYYQDRFFAIITQELGFEHLQMEIFSDPNAEKWCFELADALEAIDTAKKRLWELKRVVDK